MARLIGRGLGETYADKWRQLVRSPKESPRKKEVPFQPRLEYLKAAPPGNQDLLTNLGPSFEPGSVIKSEASLMSTTIVKTLHFQQSNQFPISKSNVRLRNSQSPGLRIKAIRSKQNNLTIQLTIDIDRNLAHTIEADLEVSSGKLFYLFTIRVATNRFKLLNVHRPSEFRRFCDPLLYLMGISGFFYFLWGLGRSAWSLYKEVELMMRYLRKDADHGRLKRRVENIKRSVVRLFDGLGKKVMRILSALSSLNRVFCFFIRVERKSKLRRKNQKLQISTIESHLTRDRVRNRFNSDDRIPTKASSKIKPGHNHLISKQGVIKQLYIERKYSELKEHAQNRLDFETGLEDKWWILKNICRRRKYYRNDEKDFKEIQALDNKVWRSQRKKTVQISKKQSEVSEITQSVIVSRVVQKSRVKREFREWVPTRTRKIPLEFDFLDFQEKGILPTLVEKRDQDRVIFQGNAFFSSTKFQGPQNSMIVEEESEENPQLNWLQKTLKRREKSVFWNIQHGKDVHLEKQRMTIPKTRLKEEGFWPTFVFCMNPDSGFKDYLRRFETKHPDFDYQKDWTRESSEKGSLANQVASEESRGERVETRKIQERLYTSISKVNESHSFSIEKNLVEMMDQKKIQAKYSMEEIADTNLQKAEKNIKNRIGKVKSQTIGIRPKVEISNEEYFDILDQEKGSKQTRLNDIFKNFKTKKIVEEREEFMEFPFAISEEENSQDELDQSEKTISRNPTILKTESYQIVGSTSSFRSGKGSRFRKKKSTLKSSSNMVGVIQPTIAGFDNNSSVYSGKQSMMSLENRPGRLAAQKSTLLSKDMKTESLISMKSKKSKKSKRSKRSKRNRKKKVQGQRVKIDNQDESGLTGDRTFRGLDDTILREKKDESADSDTHLSKKQREAQIEQSILKFEKTMYGREEERETTQPAFSWVKSESVQDSPEFYPKPGFMEIPELLDPHFPNFAMQTKKKKHELMKKKLKEKKSKLSKQDKKKREMMFPPGYMPDPRYLQMHGQPGMFPMGYSAYSGYQGIPMMPPMNVHPRAYPVKKKSGYPNMAYMNYMNPHIPNYMGKPHMQPPSNEQWNYQMEMITKAKKKASTKRQQSKNVSLKEKVIKFESSNEEDSEESKVQTSSWNIQKNKWEEEERSMEHFMGAKQVIQEDSESEEERFNLGYDHLRTFDRGFLKNVTPSDEEAVPEWMSTPKQSASLRPQIGLDFLYSDEDSQTQKAFPQKHTPQDTPTSSKDEIQTPVRLPLKNQCFLEDNIFTDAGKKREKFNSRQNM